MKIGLIIKDLRIRKGMTQEELAEKTELSARTIQRIENGEVDPRAYTLQMIAKALEVDFSIFTKNESDENKDFSNIDERNWFALLHLSGLLPLFFPTMMIWKRKKDYIKGITDHYHAVISLQSTILFFCLGGLWVLYLSRKPTIIIMALILRAFISITNTLRVLNGKPYKYFRLFKIKG